MRRQGSGAIVQIPPVYDGAVRKLRRHVDEAGSRNREIP